MDKHRDISKKMCGFPLNVNANTTEPYGIVLGSKIVMERSILKQDTFMTNGGYFVRSKNRQRQSETVRINKQQHMVVSLTFCKQRYVCNLNISQL